MAMLTTFGALVVVVLLSWGLNVAIQVPVALSADVSLLTTRSEMVESAIQFTFGIAICVGLGYALAMPLLMGKDTEATRTRMLIFPAVVAACSILGMYCGPALPFAYAFSFVFPPAHAGWLSWLLAMVVGSFATTVLVRVASRYLVKRRAAVHDA